MSNVIECCANCKYWDFYKEGFAENDMFDEYPCRRYPPSIPCFENAGSKWDTDVSLSDIVLCLVRNMPLVDHPYTFGDEWCGEFRCIDEPRVFEDEVVEGDE